MMTAYLSIGSNIEDRYAHLVEAIRSLQLHAQISVVAISSIYETTPVGFVDQADFLNLVVEVETNLHAQELLSVCQQIENEQGRVRDIRWGPRTVDLDILLYNNDNIVVENLIVPHPRMHERAFVLIPLVEIAPAITEPVTGEAYCEKAAIQEEGIQKWKERTLVEQILQ